MGLCLRSLALASISNFNFLELISNRRKRARYYNMRSSTLKSGFTSGQKSWLLTSYQLFLFLIIRC